MNGMNPDDSMIKTFSVLYIFLFLMMMDHVVFSLPRCKGLPADWDRESCSFCVCTFELVD